MPRRPHRCIRQRQSHSHLSRHYFIWHQHLLRLYVRNTKIQPLMLNSLRFVVAGAEKLHAEVRSGFSQKFNIAIYEGYGATEVAPVASVNLPDKLELESWQTQVGQRAGSVGMPLPGTSVKIVDPQIFSELPTGEAGMILIGGPRLWWVI